MLNRIMAVGVLFILAIALYTPNLKAQSTSIYDIPLKSLNGEDINLADFKGKKILIVNTASKCGYTGQYEGLEELHQQHGDKLVIIGVPCNQFGKQEPGSSEEITAFCKKNYGVSFLMAEKTDVKGDKQHALYAWLTQKSQNGVMDANVSWNFNKFLVDEKGNLVKHYKSGVKPMSEELISDIQK